MYDIIIAGAGPAGATLGRLLGKSHKILILEKRQHYCFYSAQRKDNY